MQKVITLVTTLTFLLQVIPATAIATQQSKPKTFAQWR